MKNLIAGVSLIAASVISLVAFAFTRNNDCVLMCLFAWLIYFILGLYVLFFARDKPSP